MLKYPNKVVLAFEIAAYIIQNRVQVANRLEFTVNNRKYTVESAVRNTEKHQQQNNLREYPRLFALRSSFKTENTDEHTQFCEKTLSSINTHNSVKKLYPLLTPTIL